MIGGPKFYFYVPTIMCSSCCDNISAALKPIYGVSTVEAIAFDQDKKNGGCIEVSLSLGRNVQASDLIAAIHNVDVRDNVKHSGTQAISSDACSEMISQYKRKSLTLK